LKEGLIRKQVCLYGKWMNKFSLLYAPVISDWLYLCILWNFMRSFETILPN